MGFVFGGSISYLSDVSHIPDGVYEQIDEAAAARSRRLGLSDTRLPLLVLDCLKVLNHPSHFGLAQSIDALQRIRPLRTYFVSSLSLANHKVVANRLWRRLGSLTVRLTTRGSTCASCSRATPPAHCRQTRHQTRDTRC